MKVIDSKIVGFSVGPAAPKPPPVAMHEGIERPDVLEGRTYRLKSPAVLDAALYITINDAVLNAGTPHEKRHPYEIFINTKDPKSLQWMTLATRLMSAVFRKGGDVTFVIDEMRSIYDPSGGHFAAGKQYHSVIGEIADIVEKHLRHLGIMGPAQPVVLKAVPAPATAGGHSLAPASGQSCPKCHSGSLVRGGGCETCNSCGYSKCG